MNTSKNQIGIAKTINYVSNYIKYRVDGNEVMKAKATPSGMNGLSEMATVVSCSHKQVITTVVDDQTNNWKHN